MVFPEQPPPLPSSVLAQPSPIKVAIFRPLSWPFWHCVAVSIGLFFGAWFFPPVLILPPSLWVARTWQRWRQGVRGWRLVLGILLTLATGGTCVLLAIVLWARAELHQASRQAQEIENVQLLVRALDGWKAEHQAYPPDLLTLVQAGWVPWPRLISPWHRGKPQAGTSDYQYQRLPDGRFLLSRGGKHYHEMLKSN